MLQSAYVPLRAQYKVAVLTCLVQIHHPMLRRYVCVPFLCLYNFEKITAQKQRNGTRVMLRIIGSTPSQLCKHRDKVDMGYKGCLHLVTSLTRMTMLATI